MSGMAEVLSAHAFVVLDFDQHGGACFCGEEFKWKLPTIHSKINALATHQAAALAAAGFGSLEAAAVSLHDWYQGRMAEDPAEEATEYERGRAVGITEGILSAALKIEAEAST